jgi:hypothetical protein
MNENSFNDISPSWFISFSSYKFFINLFDYSFLFSEFLKNFDSISSIEIDPDLSVSK